MIQNSNIIYDNDLLFLCSYPCQQIPFGLLSTQFTSAIAHQDKVPEAETTAQVMRFCGNGLGTASAVLDTEEAQTIASTAVPYYSLCCKLCYNKFRRILTLIPLVETLLLLQ